MYPLPKRYNSPAVAKKPIARLRTADTLNTAAVVRHGYQIRRPASVAFGGKHASTAKYAAAAPQPRFVSVSQMPHEVIARNIAG